MHGTKSTPNLRQSETGEMQCHDHSHLFPSPDTPAEPGRGRRYIKTTTARDTAQSEGLVRLTGVVLNSAG